jgi:hypothetical protein
VVFIFFLSLLDRTDCTSRKLETWDSFLRYQEDLPTPTKPRWMRVCGVSTILAWVGTRGDSHWWWQDTQGNCLKIPVIYHIDFWGQKSNGHWANNCSRTHTYDGGGGAVRTKERGKDTRPKLARIFYAIDRKNELFLQHSSLDMASDRSIWVVAFHIPTSKFLWPGCWDKKLFKLSLHLNYGVIWLWNWPMEIIRLFGKGVDAGIIAFWSKALTVRRNSARTIVSDCLIDKFAGQS